MEWRISGNKVGSGGFSARASGRCGEQGWLGGSDELPWWKTAAEGSVASFVNKRLLPGARDLQVLLLSSAGRGGEGEEERKLLVFGDGKCRERLTLVGADSAVDPAIPKRQRYLAAAIFGHKSGLAELELGCGSGLFFLLQWRIYLCFGVASSAAAGPSGFVPGVNGGGYIWRQFAGGVLLGLDRVFAAGRRVCVVNCKDLAVIFFLFGVLFVIPPY